MKKLILPIFLVCLAVAGFTICNTRKKEGPILNHIALYVYDLNKSTAFYRDMLQIDTIPEPFHDGRHTWFKISPESQLHLIQGAKKGLEHDKNNHLCFSVSSIEDFIERLDKNNISYTNWAGTGKIPTTRVDGVKQIYFQDPDGYWIEINNDNIK